MGTGPTNRPTRSRSRQSLDPRAEPQSSKSDPTLSPAARATTRPTRVSARTATDTGPDNAAAMQRRVASLSADLAGAQAVIARLEGQIEADQERVGEMLKRVAEAERERASMATRLAEAQKWLEGERASRDEIRQALEDERRRAEFAGTAQKNQIDRVSEDFFVERALVGELKRALAEHATSTAELRAELAAARGDATGAVEKARSSLEIELLMAHNQSLDDQRSEHRRALADAEGRATTLATALSEAHTARANLAAALVEMTRDKETLDAALATERARFNEVGSAAEELERLQAQLSNTTSSLALLRKKLAPQGD